MKFSKAVVKGRIPILIITLLLMIPAVLGMIGKEGIILRRTIWPFLLYCLVAGTVCFVLIGRVL